MLVECRPEVRCSEEMLIIMSIETQESEHTFTFLLADAKGAHMELGLAIAAAEKELEEDEIAQQAVDADSSGPLDATLSAEVLDAMPGGKALRHRLRSELGREPRSPFDHSGEDHRG